MWLFSSLL
jgi:hypothetical protein